MTVLLDTHVALWLLEDNSRLGPQARERISEGSAVYLSAASVWEIAIKASLGKLALPDDFADVLDASGLQDLPVTRRHALATDLAALPHRDPFDAVLVTQARLERLVLLTADSKLLGAVPEAVDATL